MTVGSARVAGWLDAFQRMPDRQRPLRVLVLGDPTATLCHSVAQAGHIVACCPDEQSVRGGRSHVNIVRSRAADLVNSGVDFDMVVALDGWQRLIDTNPRPVLEAVLDWCRTASSVLVVAAPRRRLAPDLNDLGPFDLLPLLGRFTYLAEVAPDDDATPVVLASDHALLVGSEWIAAHDAQWVGREAQDSLTAPVRTYRVRGSRIVKVECTSEDYFERAQVASEAAFLSSATEAQRSALGLPRVHRLVRGRCLTALVRDEIAGAGEPDATTRLAGVIDAAADFASVGLFHNDVRPWNVVWDGRRARFVDYSDSSEHDDDVRDLPQVLALAGTLAAIATDEIRPGESFHDDVVRVAGEAGLLNRWPLALQLTRPWLDLPARRDAIDVRADMSASEIIERVLAATNA